MDKNIKREEYWEHYDNIKGKIASNSFPIFFYGPNTEDRVEFIKKIASEFPFSEDPDKRYVLYTDDIGIEQKDGEKENPDYREYNDFLARDYLYYGILKSFVEDVNKAIPDSAESLINENTHIRMLFGNISVTDLLEKMTDTMKLIKKSYESPSMSFNQIPFRYNNGEMSRFMIMPMTLQNIICEFCNRRGKTSFVLDIKHQLVLASMHAINDIVSERNSTRIILPQDYKWGYVRGDEKHQEGHDFTDEFLTEEAYKVFKRNMGNNRYFFY